MPKILKCKSSAHAGQDPYIQHPDRIRNKIKEQSELKKGKVFPVEASRVEENISMLSGSSESLGTVGDSSAY